MTRAYLVAPLLAIPATVSAYQLKETKAGLPLRWGEGELTFTIAMNDVPEGVLPARVERAVGSAVETWAVEMPVGVELRAEAVGGRPDGGNLVTWVHEGWEDEFDVTALAMTLTTYDSGSGRIKDADVFVNAEEFAWETDRNVDDAADCEGRYDVENVVTHELGHALGLAHEETNEDATMFPRADTCETKKRDLDGDDEAGLLSLYSTAAPLEAPESSMALGCSAGGRGRGTPAAAVLVLGFVLATSRRHHRRAGRAVLFVSLVGAAVAASSAHATTLRRASLAELAAHSAAIVRGVVVERRVVERNGRLYTDHVVAVTETWKGLFGDTVVVRVLGGEKDGVGLIADGAPVLGEGELLLFLRPRRDGHLSVTGLAQGAFHVAAEGRDLLRTVAGKRERFSLEQVRSVSVSVSR